MKIALFGGSFDPIHNGHIMLVRHFADILELDKVYVVPAKTPPHKEARRTPGEMRLEMCRLALEGDDRMEASDIELRREGVSYTFYTVKELLEKHPGCDMYLITGADMFMTLSNWHRFGELSELVTFCSVPRDNVNTEQLWDQAERLGRVGCRTLVTDVGKVDISSTMVRRCIDEGLPLDGFVPPAVQAYIEEHGLYRDTYS